MTAVAYVIGYPVEHSRSPAMMTAAFAHLGMDAVMHRLAAAPEELPAALARLRAERAVGASVTLPHKVATRALCDDLSDAARAIGAVNCVVVEGARLVGHNTDAPGFVDSLHAAGFEHAGKRVAILGAGGAARAVAYGLAGADLAIVARDPARVTWTAARAWRELPALLPTVELVVDTTPVGLADTVAHDVPLASLAPHAMVATLIYHRTPALLVEAAARGHVTLDGRGMLAYQGARAFALWFGRPAPVDVMLAAI